MFNVQYEDVGLIPRIHVLKQSAAITALEGRDRVDLLWLTIEDWAQTRKRLSQKPRLMAPKEKTPECVQKYVCNLNTYTHMHTHRHALVYTQKVWVG